MSGCVKFVNYDLTGLLVKVTVKGLFLISIISLLMILKCHMAVG